MKIKREELKKLIFQHYSKRPDLACFEYLESLRNKKYEDSEKEVTFIKVKNFVRNFKKKFEQPKFGKKKILFEKFHHEWLHSLCSDTYRALSTKYSWVLVSPTVYKILAHSAEFAESLPLPVGMF
jgi:hypothetical protein